MRIQKKMTKIYLALAFTKPSQEMCLVVPENNMFLNVVLIFVKFVTPLDHGCYELNRWHRTNHLNGLGGNLIDLMQTI